MGSLRHARAVEGVVVHGISEKDICGDGTAGPGGECGGFDEIEGY